MHASVCEPLRARWLCGVAQAPGCVSRQPLVPAGSVCVCAVLLKGCFLLRVVCCATSAVWLLGTCVTVGVYCRELCVRVCQRACVPLAAGPLNDHQLLLYAG